eukprot:scaffold1543_cov128-Skeletonema_menzelii.AAC.10
MELPLLWAHPLARLSRKPKKGTFGTTRPELLFQRLAQAPPCHDVDKKPISRASTSCCNEVNINIFEHSITCI